MLLKFSLVLSAQSEGRQLRQTLGLWSDPLVGCRSLASSLSLSRSMARSCSWDSKRSNSKTISRLMSQIESGTGDDGVGDGGGGGSAAAAVAAVADNDSSGSTPAVTGNALRPDPEEGGARSSSLSSGST